MRQAIAGLVMAVILMGCGEAPSAPGVEPSMTPGGIRESTARQERTSNPRVTPIATIEVASTPIATASPAPGTFGSTATPASPSAIDAAHGSSAWATLQAVETLEEQHPELATAILSLPWVRDGIIQDETEGVQELVWMALDAPGAFRIVVQRSWIGDGLSDGELGVLENLGIAGYADKAVAQWLVGLPFLERVTPESAEGVANLIALSFIGRGFAQTVFEQWWVADGLDHRETSMVESLYFLGAIDRNAALRILDMPFLTTIETSDMLALHSLVWVEDPLGLLSHQSLRGGITDAWAKRIMVLYEHPNAGHLLLDPAWDLVTERQVTLPLAGEATIALISDAARATSEQILDIMESAVRHHEDYMRSPFPTDYIVLVFGGPAFGEGGYFKDTHVFLQRDEHVDANVIAHELAHYYWSHSYGGSFWVDEGLADLLAYRSLQLGHLNALCSEFRAIADLERATSGSSSPVHCEYSLGMRLFADLERSLGEFRFRHGLRNLYLAQRAEGFRRVEQVIAAFEAVDGVQKSDVGRVFGRWYHGSHPYEQRVLDPGPVDGSVPGIGGRIADAYVSATSGGPPTSSLSGRDQDAMIAWLTLRLDYAIGQDAEVDIEIVQYFEDGFAYRSEQASFTVDAGRTDMEVAIPISVFAKAGQHGIYVYHQGRKVAQVEFDVTR